MLLSLLRHAEAVAHATNDAERELTPKGVEQARRVGEFLRAHGGRIDAILSSPFKRAEQTARIAAEKIGVRVTMENFLASGMAPQHALEGLARYSTLAHVMIVGHEPDFGELAAALMGLSSGARLHLRKASLTTLALDKLQPGSATLEHSIPAALM